MRYVQITESVLREALRVHDCPAFTASRVVIDSRQATSGDLFIAIMTGNRFTADALANGATMAIIDDARYVVDGRTVLVDDSLKALKDIGNYIKLKAEPDLLIGITGSVGKTTTRQWLHSVLSSKFNVVSSMRNYNTKYGLPICLTTLDPSTNVGIFEMGSSNPGELAELSTYLNPDIGVITTICEAHIGRFGSMQEIIQEKISVMDGIKKGGVVVYDGDLECASMIEKRAASRNISTISVGFNAACDFRVKSFRGNSVELSTTIGSVEYQIASVGRHFAYMSACVVAAIYAMGLKPQNFLEYFSNLEPMDGRGVSTQYVTDGIRFTLIDDSYNASPTSVLVALDSLDTLNAPSKIVVIGQMHELGDYTVHYHKLVAERLHSMDLQSIFFIGDRDLFDTMSHLGPITCFEVADDVAAHTVLQSIQSSGSVVLLKGSRSAALDRIILYIHKRCNG
ncbi:MAG: UDP-N-acetylmuramoyl-tripeptide--D-alanyl-D-alanine ligase [Holosporales bacterium]|jgi:UDP-N-acetylmuramoyl-tripeptide--D-alanyl-D-alanine ligase|nr:UDP-N-acetylmuramoyl-tripeptide--D-alanyl-D-alanine ligase [Holosporales bacterium]